MCLPNALFSALKGAGKVKRTGESNFFPLIYKPLTNSHHGSGVSAAIQMSPFPCSVFV